MLSLVDAAKMAERSPERLRQYIRDGRLRGELIGNSYVVRESEIRRLILDKYRPRKAGWPKGKPRKPAPPAP